MIGHIIIHRGFWLLAVMLWSAVVAVSYGWNSSNLSAHAETMAMERGRSFFNVIVMTRQWNAQHGRVYVPITTQTQPNPYLELPDRDVLTTDGQQLTAINPSYMTRQLSELADSQGIIFHLTSLRPLNPGNAPDPWEKSALEAFEAGRREVLEIREEENGRFVYRYMAPLRVTSACMSCHAKQGYQVGDIRGGLSVNLNVRAITGALDSQYRSLMIDHALSWLIVTLLILVFLHSVRKHTLFLQGVSVDQGQQLSDQQRQLEEAEEQLQDLVTRDTTTGIHTIEHFKTLAEDAWSHAVERHATAAIILLEIDHFHDYTDNYGALEGDYCLKQVTSAIGRTINFPGGIIGRYGAASFILMLTERSEAEIRDLVERIHGAVIGLGIPHETSEISRVVTVTGAFSLARPKSGSSVMSLTRKVRDCLVRSKRGQRNKIYHCS